MHAKYQEEAELVLQNTLMLWGINHERLLSEDFVVEVTQSEAMNRFLSLTSYSDFAQSAHDWAVRTREQDAKLGEDKPNTFGKGAAASLREAPVGDATLRKKLASIDYRLAELGVERTALLLERWRLAGCTIEQTTASALKHAVQRRRYQDDVGLD